MQTRQENSQQSWGLELPYRLSRTSISLLLLPLLFFLLFFCTTSISIIMIITISSTSGSITNARRFPCQLASLVFWRLFFVIMVMTIEAEFCALNWFASRPFRRWQERAHGLWICRLCSRLCCKPKIGKTLRNFCFALTYSVQELVQVAGESWTETMDRGECKRECKKSQLPLSSTWIYRRFNDWNQW